MTHFTHTSSLLSLFFSLLYYMHVLTQDVASFTLFSISLWSHIDTDFFEALVFVRVSERGGERVGGDVCLCLDGR